MFENYSIWDKLRETSKPIFLYGTGNGADKIINALEAHGASLTGVFASDGFVRDRSFRGYKVRSYSDTVAEFGDNIIVLLGFGTTLPDVCKFIDMIDERHELIIPDVPLYGGEVFDYHYFVDHRHIIDEALGALYDEKSKEIFVDAINFRLTGKIKYSLRTDCWHDSLVELFDKQKICSVLDGGAFKGDTCQEFINALNPQRIYAVEADPKTFLKLATYSRQTADTTVTPINAALWNSSGEIEYVHSGSRGSGEIGANKRAKISMIPCSTIDDIVGDSHIDLIKLDIEGAEAVAIDGALKTITRCKPNMIVSLYHKTDDLYELILRIKSLLPEHKLFLRRIPCLPMWDINLYAVKNIKNKEA